MVAVCDGHSTVTNITTAATTCLCQFIKHVLFPIDGGEERDSVEKLGVLYCLMTAVIRH